MDFWHQLGQAVAPAIIVLASAASAWLVKWSREPHKKQDKPFNLGVQEDIEIDIILDRALERTGALRMYLVRITNGIHSVDDSSLHRKMITHERVRPGASRQIRAANDGNNEALISQFVEEMKLVVADGPSFTLVRNLPECRFRRTCENRGAVAVARQGIFRNGQPVAYLAADFDTEVKPENIDTLTNDVYLIDGILDR